MNTSWGIIVAVIYVVVHVIAALSKEAAKKKQREKQMEEAERRRIAEAHLEPPPIDPSAARDPLFTPAPMRRGSGLPQPVAVPTSHPVRTGKPVDDLAARRQAQLEKLRMGRTVQSRPDSPSSLPTPEAFRRPSAPAAPPSPARVLEEKARQERERRQRAQGKLQVQKRQRDDAALAKRQRESHRAAADIPDIRPTSAIFTGATEATEATGATAKTLSQTAVGARGAPIAIQSRLRNKASLRELFILKELIDPPLAMRSQ